MTGSIKPPSNHPPLPATGPSEAGAGKAAGATTEFRQELTTTPDIPSQRVLASAISDVALAELAESVRAGRIDAGGVVKAIIDRALASPAASTLSDAARERLAAALSSHLTEDPVLAGLVADLGKSR